MSIGAQYRSILISGSRSTTEKRSQRPPPPASAARTDKVSHRGEQMTMPVLPRASKSITYGVSYAKALITNMDMSQKKYKATKDNWQTVQFIKELQQLLQRASWNCEYCRRKF